MRLLLVMAALVMVCGCRSAGEAVDLKSSAIRRATYDDASRTLTLHFGSGAVYDYAGVPAPVFQELQTAESAGRYYHDHIRGQYETTLRSNAGKAP